MMLYLDPDYHNKLLLLPEETGLESCYPNPCQHGGRCASDDVRSFCQCSGYYTGELNLHLQSGKKEIFQIKQFGLLIYFERKTCHTLNTYIYILSSY